MRVKSIAGYNFSGFDNISVSFDESLTYLIGPNGAGKTRVGLNLLWFILQGIAEKSSEGKIPLIGERFRFIGDNGATALGEMVLFDEHKKIEIRVIRKLTKTGTELSFSAPLGMKLDQQWLNELFNLFLIAPKRFIELPALDQARALGIDTTKEYDMPIAELKKKFTQINKEISKYDNLEEVIKVEAVDLTKLQERKNAITTELNELYMANKQVNKNTRLAYEAEKKEWDDFVQQFNIQQIQASQSAGIIAGAINTLKEEGYESQDLIDFCNKKYDSVLPKIYAENFYPDEPIDLQNMPDDFVPAAGQRVYIKELPDNSKMVEVDAEIFTASQTNIDADKYKAYLEKLEDKQKLEKDLQENKTKQNEKYAARVEYIKSFKFPFEKLSVDDDGGLLLNDNPLKPPYFSTGELIRIIPNLMSS